MREDRIDPNRKTYNDPLTGTEVRRLAMHGIGCIQPYFTNLAFAEGGRSFIYLAEDEKHCFEMYKVNAEGGPAMRLTHSTDKVPEPSWYYPCKRFTGVNWASCAVGPKTNKVYYYVGFQVFKLDIATLKTDLIYEIPRDRTPAIPHLSFNEDLLLIPTTDRKIEEVPESATRQREVHDLVKQAKLTSDITIVKTSGGAEKTLEENSWITHVQFSPTDSNLILYCHEGIWQQVEQRIWLLNTSTGQSRRIRDQRGTNLQIGHELWLDDGKHILYHGWDGKKDDPRAGWSMAGIIDIETDQFTEWQFLDGTFYGHFYSWGTGDYLITDGVWDQKLLHLIHAKKDGTWAKKPICRTDSSWKSQELHPHPRVSPDGKWTVFNSDRDGTPAIYMARLPELG